MFRKLFDSIKAFFTKNKYRKALFICLCVMLFCIVVGIWVEGMFIGATIAFAVADLYMYLEARRDYKEIAEIVEEKASAAYDRMAERIGKEQAYAKKTPFDAQTDVYFKKLLRTHKQRMWIWMAFFLAVGSVVLVQMWYGYY